MKKIIILLTIIFIAGNIAFSEKNNVSVNNDLKTTNAIPDYNTIMGVNKYLSGFAQLSMGDDMGWLYMTSLPLTVAGYYLIIDYWFNDLNFPDTNCFLKYVNNKNYLYYDVNEYTNANKWKIYAGVVCAIFGQLLRAYSQYDARRQYIEKYGVENANTNITNIYIKDNLFEMITAPWKPENILNFDFFPMYPLTVVASFSSSDYYKLGEYFKRDTVKFLGMNVNPLAGLGLIFASAVLLVSANATWEEIYFRGLNLNDSGLWGSTLSFGPLHFFNCININTSVEDSIKQAMFATLWGFYSGLKTMENGYDFKRMIALHFWHNVTVMVFNYLINPDSQLYFSVTLPVRF